MRHLLFSLAMIFYFALFSQATVTTEVFRNDTLFYEVTRTVEDNGTPIDNSRGDTTIIGDFDEARRYILNGHRRDRRRFNRLSTELIEQDYDTRRRVWEDMATFIGFDLDSSLTANLVSEIFVEDTFSVRIPNDVLDLYVADVGLPLIEEVKDRNRNFTILPAYIFQTNAGLYQVRTELLPTIRWRLSVISPNDFSLRNVSGPSTGFTNFLLIENNDRRSVYRDRIIASGRRAHISLIIRSTQ